jgi:hypothetical protein
MIADKIRCLIIFLIILLTLSVVNAADSDFVITNISQIEFLPSESTSLTITFENIGSGTAYDLISELNTEGLPIRNLGDSKIYVEYVKVHPLGENFTSVTYVIYVDELAAKGVYVIPLTLGWKTESRSSKIKTYTISVRVVGARNIGKIQIKNINLTPATIYPGYSFNTEFSLKNVGGEAADSITLGLRPSYPVSSIGNIPTSYISHLNPNEEVIVNFTLVLDKSAKPKLYEIGVELEYFTKDILISTNDSFGIVIEESVGILDISNITTNPKIIAPGDIFDILFTPRNLGSETINEINIKLIPKPPFASIGGAPDVFLNSLGPNESKRIAIKMNVDRIAPTRQFYPMDFVVEYTSRNLKFTKNGSFGIVVKGGPKIYIQELIVEPTRLEPNREGLMMVRLINSGTERAEDLKIKISGGDNIFTENYQFMGELETDRIETTSFGIYTRPGIKPGTYGLVVNISYYDRYGNPYTTLKTFDLNIFNKSGSRLFNILIVGGVISVFLLVLLIVMTGRERIKKQ